MAETALPVQLYFNNDGEMVKMLFHEDWYDSLKPIYDRFKTVNEIITIKDIPKTPNQFSELFQQLSINFGSHGWFFGACIISAIIIAAEKLVSVGKFTYEKVSYGESYGKSYGGGTVVSEIPLNG